MPKKTGTRKHIAQDVYGRLKRGPSPIGHDLDGANPLEIDNLPELTYEQRAAVNALVKRHYATWINCWIIPDLCRLNPEINAIHIAEMVMREANQSKGG